MLAARRQPDGHGGTRMVSNRRPGLSRPGARPAPALVWCLSITTTFLREIGCALSSRALPLDGGGLGGGDRATVFGVKTKGITDLLK
jgi:hypothetical protein